MPTPRPDVTPPVRFLFPSDDDEVSGMFYSGMLAGACLFGILALLVYCLFRAVTL